MSRFLITSALPYINGVKHVGNLIGSMLPADVHARFRRLQGHEVLFICGTDEHGTPAELAAAEAGIAVRAYCDQQYEAQKRACDGFNLSFDHFGRSSSAQNHALTQDLAERLDAVGLIEERITLQLYSPRDGRFLPDRYVEGTCPRCGYGAARGDQCDGCGSLLDAIDLLEPRSCISGARDLEVRETRHLFLLQSKLAVPLRAWMDSRKEWKEPARGIAYKALNEGLQDRAITRDLSWGVPVTKDGAVRPGFENKVFYVWFDAPIAYIAATQQWAAARGQDWERWWRLDHGAEDVTYIQVMGKDNVAFHTVSFPGTILGSGAPYRLVDRLKAFNWLQWGEGKFSSSRGVGIFMDEALEMRPADDWRWYLLATVPEGSDSKFSWKDFDSKINADLVNTFGNLVNRVFKLAANKCEGRIPADVHGGEPSETLRADLEAQVRRLTAAHEDMAYRRTADETRALWALGNKHIAETAPWQVTRSDGRDQAAVIREALELLRIIATATLPLIPDSAAKVLRALGEDPSSVVWPTEADIARLNRLTTGASLCDPGLLFKPFDPGSVPAG